MGKIIVGVIGIGRMGKKHIRNILDDGRWRIKYLCDISEEGRADAMDLVPDAVFTENEDDIFSDPEVDAVTLTALADLRYDRVEKAVRTGKHIIAEKPIACDRQKEWACVDLVESSNVFSTVDLYLRNAWYTNEIKSFVGSGEIGELAIMRICHMTPGLSPGEGHEAEGPAFHDCGMHYVDIARWFAGSDYKTMDAQAVRMWAYKDPWWLQCHGTFENGVVYDITQGHVYGQLSKDQTHNSYMDIIGTKGIVRMTHDFRTAVVEKRGITVTERVERPYGDKNIDSLYRMMGESILTGRRDAALPSFRDAAIASDIAWQMIDNAREHEMPVKGTAEELDAIHYRRANMTNGYGLLRR